MNRQERFKQFSKTVSIARNFLQRTFLLDVTMNNPREVKIIRSIILRYNRRIISKLIIGFKYRYSKLI